MNEVKTNQGWTSGPVVQGMRAWLTASPWVRLPADAVGAMSDRQVCALMDARYEGGALRFVTVHVQRQTKGT